VSASAPQPPPPPLTLDALPPEPHVVTVGTFDGVHLGHRHLIGQTAARGRELGLPTLAVTFEPPPAAVLRPDAFRGRLCTPEEKRTELLACGADLVAVVPFTRALAAESAEAFMARLAATGLRELWVGDDFALGHRRTGDLPRLREIGADLGFAVVAVPRISLAGDALSSSAIRAAVLAGEVAAARRLLGRPFRVGGEVIHGKKLGRTIGFPTANVAPPPDLVPLADGIYATWAWLPGDAAPRPAITYVGTRPTVNGGPRLVETHLLDFDGDLYGQDLRVDLLERLRADETFGSLDAMVEQLKRDEARARAVLAAADVAR
jgi:riboflavin kinase/FMN adenylyltransferase